MMCVGVMFQGECWSSSSISGICVSLQALSKLEDMKLKDEAEEDQWKAMILKLYLNMALCCHKQRKPKMVITFSKKALEIDSDNVKAHFRLGQVNTLASFLLLYVIGACGRVGTYVCVMENGTSCSQCLHDSLIYVIQEIIRLYMNGRGGGFWEGVV